MTLPATRQGLSLLVLVGLGLGACGNDKSDPAGDGGAGNGGNGGSSATAGVPVGGSSAGKPSGGSAGAGALAGSAGKGGTTGTAGSSAGHGNAGRSGDTASGGTSGVGSAGGTSASGGAGNSSGGAPTGGVGATSGATGGGAGEADAGMSPGGTSGSSSDGPPLADPRDGNTYKTVVLDGQTWMAENLNFETASGSWCENDDPALCAQNGRYYDWSVALGLPIECDMAQCTDQIGPQQQGVCPDGWHVTTYDEWRALFVKTEDCLKAKSTTGWTSGAGNDEFGLTVLPVGYHLSTGIERAGSGALFWTTNDEQALFTRAWSFGTTGCGSDQYGKNYGISVRCIMN